MRKRQPVKAVNSYSAILTKLFLEAKNPEVKEAMRADINKLYGVDIEQVVRA